MKNLNCSHPANGSNPTVASWNCVAAWECGLLVHEERVLGANLELQLLSFALSSTYLTNVHVPLRKRRGLFLVLLQDGPILSLSLRFYLVTEDSVDTFQLSDNDRKCFCHSTFAMLTRFVIQLGAFAATDCFPSGLSFKNK